MENQQNELLKHEKVKKATFCKNLIHQNYGVHAINRNECSTLHKSRLSNEYCDKISLNFENLVCNILSVRFFNSFKTFTLLKSISFGFKEVNDWVTTQRVLPQS